MMLVLTAVLGVAAVLYSTARWHRAGVHFHPLFQIQLMGLNGAFLTADLFNLFVFFEVMLAASYGLLLHGSGDRARARRACTTSRSTCSPRRCSWSASRMLYGVTGTLAMADMAQKLAAIPAADRGLLHAGVAILAVAFLAKAAMWPLGFWLRARLLGGERAGRGDVRDHDQGGRLRGGPRVDALLSGRRGVVRRSAPTRWWRAASSRWRSDRSASWPRSGSDGSPATR